MARLGIKFILIAFTWKIFFVVDCQNHGSFRDQLNAIRNATGRHISRDYRLSMIKQNVLWHLRWSTPPTMDPEQRQRALENWRRMITNGPGVLDEIRRTEETNYDSECTVPFGHVDDAWHNSNCNTFNVFFNVQSDDIDPGSSVEVLNATLKLKVKSRSECQCSDEINFNRILLYIHQYEDNLTSRRCRRRGRAHRRGVITTLINAMMLIWDEPKWIELNVTESAINWSRDPHTNKGFEIVAQDIFGNIIDAKRIFSQLDCPTQSQRSRRHRGSFSSSVSQRRFMSSAANRDAPKLKIFREITPQINLRKRRDLEMEKESYVSAERQQTIPQKIYSFAKSFLH